MKRTILLTLMLAAILAMQLGAAVTHAEVGPALLDPRDGMYMTRIINLTSEQLSIAVTNDSATSPFTNSYGNLYTTGFSTASNPLNNQQNIFTPTPIQLDTMVKHSSKTYAFPQGNAYWEGMINLAPLIPAANENNSYITYSGHFSQGQRLTISTVNNPNSILNNAYIQFGYVYSSTQTILWGNVFDFAASTIKNAADITTACVDGNAAGALSSGASIIKSILSAVQTSPVTASLNSASTLSQQPTSSQTSLFTKQTTKNYAQAEAFFAGNGGSCITDAATNNQIYTLASAKQVVVTLTDKEKHVRYFTAPAYYIYIKNVEAPAVGDINECTIAIIDGWVYNLAVAMYDQAANLTALQNFSPLQLMYYAGSTVPPITPAATTATKTTKPNVPLNAKTLAPVTITNVAISYIGG